MFKKIILLVFTMLLTACSNTRTITDTNQKDEVIKQVISTSQKDVVLLGNNYDYLFTGEEARKLLTLIDFLNIKGLTNENVKQIRKELNVYEDGRVMLWVATDFVISKTNDANDKNFQREQEVFINDLKKKLEEKSIKYEIDENNQSWRFHLPNVIKVNGKVAKLKNHDKIIQETSSQLINLKIDLTEYHQREVPKYTSNDVLGGVVGVLLLPISIPIVAVYAAVYMVVLIPAFLIEDMKYKNKYKYKY
jgi:hypothetical protein